MYNIHCVYVKRRLGIKKWMDRQANRYTEIYPRTHKHTGLAIISLERYITNQLNDCFSGRKWNLRWEGDFSLALFHSVI